MQAKQLLSGLVTMQSLLSNVSESQEAEILRNIRCLVDDFHDHLIPELTDEIDFALSSESNHLATTQQKLLKNEPIVLDMEQIHHLRSIGLSWKAISQVLGVSQSTLYRRRVEANMTENCRFSDISDDDLLKLQEIRLSLPDSGERILSGSLRSCGIVVPRWRLREAIHRIDPISTTLRWRPRIKRKPYSVPGPMSLWHIGEIAL